MPAKEITSWKTVRVFISSTFRDMHAERDHLVKYVFPDLREWLARYRLHLVDIDLRWGVTREEVEDGRVIDICLEQIDGSRPFFISLLGSRYGWVPEPGAVPAETRGRWRGLAGKDDYSITHLEIQHAVFGPLGLEAVETVPHAFFYFRDQKSLPDPAALTSFDASLIEAFQEAFLESDPKRSDRLTKLKAAIEAHYMDRSPEEFQARVFTYRPEFDPGALNPEDAKLRGRFTRPSLEEFGQRVKDDLTKAIRLEFAERFQSIEARAEEDPLELEQDLHEDFVEHRTQLFVGRTALLEKLQDYVAGDSTEIMAVLGESGAGKSALLARFYRDLKYDGQGNERDPATLIIPQFIGASPASASLHSILTRMCNELKRKWGLADEVPYEIEKLPETFRDFLDKAAGRTVIVIDGLNQLEESNNAHALHWLPNKLPANVRIIASALAGPAREALERNTGNQLRVTPLSDDEKREIIQKMPSVFCKTLADEHINILLARPETANPLYLKVALEEMRVFGGFGEKGELLANKIAEFPDNPVDLFVHVLGRIELDLGETDHKPDQPGIVARLFSLIACSRYGLTGQELRELIHPHDPSDSYLLVLRQMRDYLVNRGGLIGFFHQTLAEAVRKKYLTEGREREWHGELANYFKALGLWFEPDDHSRQDPIPPLERKKHHIPNARKALEQPYQQTHAELWDDLAATLTDLIFIESKCTAGHTQDLISDYNLALRSLPEAKEEIKKEEARQARLRDYINNILQYAINFNARRCNYQNRSPAFNPNSDMPTRPEAIASIQVKYNKPKNGAPKRNDIIINSLAHISEFARFIATKILLLSSNSDICGFVIQEAYNYSGQGPVARAAEKIIELKRPENYFLIHPDRRPERLGNSFDQRTLEGHGRSTSLRSVCVTWDGEKAVSSCADNRIRVWDLRSGQCLKTINDGTLVTITPDGKKALVGGYGTALTYWDLEEEKIICRMKTNCYGSKLFCMTVDGSFALSYSGGNDESQNLDRQIQAWNLLDGKCVQMLSGHTSMVTGLAISIEGSVAVSGDRNGSIIIWDLLSFKILRKFKGHDGPITCLRFSLDGNKIFSGGEDKKIKLWKVSKKGCVRSFSTPNIPYLFCVTHDCSRGVIVGNGNELSIWDWVIGKIIASEHPRGKYRLDACCITTDSLTPAGDIFVSGGTDDSFKVWDLRGIPENNDEREKISSEDIRLTPDGKLFSLCRTGRFGYSQVKYLSLSNGSTANTSAGFPVAFLSPDGNTGVSLFGRGSVIWDMDKRKIVAFKGFSRFAMSASGRYGFARSFSREILKLDLFSNKVSASVNGTENIVDFRISPDGKLLLGVDTDRNLRFYSLEQNTLLKVVQGGGYSVLDFRFSPDGRKVVTAGMDCKIRVIDVQNGSCDHVFSRHKDYVTLVEFCPEGRMVLTGGVDEMIYLWDLGTGICTASLPGFRSFSEVKPNSNLVCATLDDYEIIRFRRNESIPIATCVRLWRHQKGQWDNVISAQCPWCQFRLAISRQAALLLGDIMASVNANDLQPPILCLPNKVWENSELIDQCPQCGQLIKLNPFIADDSPDYAKISSNNPSRTTIMEPPISNMMHFKIGWAWKIILAAPLLLKRDNFFTLARRGNIPGTRPGANLEPWTS